MTSGTSDKEKVNNTLAFFEQIRKHDKEKEEEVER
jgi:hypothetical protein